MEALAAYLRGESVRPYRIGEADCATLAADWVRLRRGVDPVAFFRGYDEARALALLSCPGSLLRLAGRALREAGLRMTRHPVPGDVAVLLVEGTVCCAIRTRRGWITRFVDGMVSLAPTRTRLVAAWSV